MKSFVVSLLVVLSSACANATEPGCEPLAEKSLSEACGQPCASLAEWDCTPIIPLIAVKVERGCGFVRFAYQGDQADTWGRVYAADSGKLVHVWFRLWMADGCARGSVAGEEPECNDWQEEACPGKR